MPDTETSVNDIPEKRTTKQNHPSSDPKFPASLESVRGKRELLSYGQVMGVWYM